MANKKSNKTTCYISYEIEMEPEQEHIMNELLAYLQYTKKIEQFRITKRVDASEHSSSEPKSSTAKTEEKDVKAQPKPEVKADADIFQLIKEWTKHNVLVRLTAVKKKGVRLDIACKILNFDEATGHLSVYDVDNKKVENIHMNELEDLKAAQK